MDSLNRRFEDRTQVYLVLLLIVAVALVLRLPGLDRDLWYDESLSLFHSRGANPLTQIIPNGPPLTSELFNSDGGWRGTLRAVSQIEQTPPLYFLLLRVWRNLFGESNRALRLLSFLLGLAAIPAMFLLGRESANAHVGLAAAGVLALLPLHVQYSHEVRAYILAFLLATVSSWAFLRAIRSLGRPGNSRWWVVYGSLTVLSLYTHYFTAGIFLAHGLHVLLQPRPVRRPLAMRFGIVIAVALLSVVPWFFLQYINQFRGANLLQPRAQAPGFWSLDTIKRLASLIGYFVAGWLPGTTFKSAVGAAILILYGIIGFTIAAISRTREFRSTVMFGSFLFVMPLVFFAGVEAVLNDSGLLLFPRFALWSLTGLCLLSGLVIVASGRRIVSLMVAVLLLSVTAHFQVQWQKVDSSPFPLPGLPWFYGNLSSAVEKVSQSVYPSELLVFDDPHLIVTWNVYERSNTPQLLMTRKDFFYLNRARDFDARWQEVQQSYQWIVVVRRVGEPPSEILNLLEATYHLKSIERIGRLELRWYMNPLSQ